MIITPSLLLQNGYREYSNPLAEKNVGYLDSYYLSVKDDKGTKYSIRLDRFNFKKFQPNMKEDKFSCTVQFNTHSLSKNTFNVDYFINEDTTIDDIQKFYDKIFVCTEADYLD